MKGIVFTEFLDMVEGAHGYEMVDELITKNDLPSGGIYTSIGTYDHREMVTLVTSLSQKTDTPVPSLLKSFGHYIFNTFEKGYPQFFDAATNAFDFLESIEQYIHVEVRKLYPDAELPRFETKRLSEDTLEMIYHSDRSMGDFALGLIEKTFERYKEAATISRENIVANASQVRFIIQKTAMNTITNKDLTNAAAQ